MRPKHALRSCEATKRAYIPINIKLRLNSDIVGYAACKNGEASNRAFYYSKQSMFCQYLYHENLHKIALT